MPLYDYQCQACGEVSEFLQKKDDADKTDCPHCHEPKLKRMVSAAAFHLKGSGWYVTDFRDKKTDKKDSTKKETPASTKAETGDSKKTKPKDKSEQFSFFVNLSSFQ